MHCCCEAFTFRKWGESDFFLFILLKHFIWLNSACAVKQNFAHRIISALYNNLCEHGEACFCSLQTTDTFSELQIRGGTEDNSKLLFFISFLNENLCYDPSLERSRQDGSNDGSQICFSGEIRLIITKLSQLPLLILSTAFLF